MITLQPDWISAFQGGILIGIAVSLMMLFNGRITGISGIIYAALTPVKNDWLWRIAFILGLFSGGLVIQWTFPEFLTDWSDVSLTTTAIAGLLVGFGTIWGSGCTSGHGVCGISRFSPRSLVATFVFISVGMIVATFIRLTTGGLS